MADESSSEESSSDESKHQQQKQKQKKVPRKQPKFVPNEVTLVQNDPLEPPEQIGREVNEEAGDPEDTQVSKVLCWPPVQRLCIYEKWKDPLLRLFKQ